jgi:hypothetical protein
MTEPFVETETDRTKSKWLAKAYQDFVKEMCRSKKRMELFSTMCCKGKSQIIPFVDILLARLGS